MRTTILTAIAAAALILIGSGCKKSGEKTKEEKSEESSGESIETVTKGDEGVKTEEKEEKTAPLGTQKLSASHILLMHEDSQRKPPQITRTKEEALALAKKLSAKIKEGEDFSKLAKEHSDCPSGKRSGGSLGVFPANRMAPAFSRGVMKLEIGGVSEPVESPFGYHIIKRQKIDEVHARHILIMHEGSKRKPPTITRSKDEAEKLIKEIQVKLKKGGDFKELAKEHSDCPSGKRGGGDLGTFGRGQMAKPFEEAAWSLKENEVSDIVETDFGYHIIQRLP